MREVPAGAVGENIAKGVAERDGILVVMVAERAGVAEELAQRDRVGEEGGIGDRVAEIVADRAVEVELALLDQPHHAQADDELADRGDADRVVGGGEASAGGVGNALGRGAEFIRQRESDGDADAVRRGWWQGQRGRGAGGQGQCEQSGCSCHGIITFSAPGRMR